MDRFSEQLVVKQPTGKDMFLRGVYIALALLLLAALVFFLGGFGLWLIALCLAACVIWGLVWLLQGTFVEYEYIVTNDDLDIDKITGKRSRKRLITVSLREGREIFEYVGDKEINAAVTVMAHDETGEGMYCFICATKEYGDVAVVFNPDKRTLYNIIGGLSPAVKAKYNELYKKLAPAEEKDKDNEDGTESEAAPEDNVTGMEG